MSKITAGIARGTTTSAGGSPIDAMIEVPMMVGVTSSVGDLGASFISPLANVAGCDGLSIQLEYGVGASPVGLVWFFGSNRVAPAAITVSGTALTAHADWTLLSGQGTGIAIPVAAAAPTLANTPAIYRVQNPDFLWLCFVYLRTSGGAADLMNAYLLGVAQGGNF